MRKFTAVVGAVNAHDIIHDDLHANNIMVLNDGLFEGNVVLIDFGMAGHYKGDENLKLGDSVAVGVMLYLIATNLPVNSEVQQKRVGTNYFGDPVFKKWSEISPSDTGTRALNTTLAHLFGGEGKLEITPLEAHDELMLFELDTVLPIVADLEPSVNELPSEKRAKAE